MEQYNPVIQFEIKYTPILDFSFVIKKIIAPFLKFSTRIGIGSENTTKETIELSFEEDLYTITVAWDRIYLKSQGNINEMKNESSFVSRIFFSLFDKVTNIENFGDIQNYLFFVSTIWIEESSNQGKKEIQKFSERFFNDKIKSIFGSYDDTAIEIVKKENQFDVRINFGPYLGIEDLNKRRIKPPFKITDFDTNRYGQMAEITIIKENEKIDFGEFKNLIGIYENYCQKLQ